MWYGIGMEFGINKEKLKRIEEQFENPGKCLSEMIKELLASKISSQAANEESVDSSEASSNSEAVKVEKGIDYLSCA